MSDGRSGRFNQAPDEGDIRSILAGNASRSNDYQEVERQRQAMRYLDAFRHHTGLVREFFDTVQGLQHQIKALRAEKEQTLAHTPMRRAVRQEIRDRKNELAILREELADHREKAEEAKSDLKALGVPYEVARMAFDEGMNS